MEALPTKGVRNFSLQCNDALQLANWAI